MGCCFSKPVPKPPEPTLPCSTARAVKCKSSNAGSVLSKRDLKEYCAFPKCFADLADGVQAKNSESEVQATAEFGVQATDILNVKNLSTELTVVTMQLVPTGALP